MQPSVSLVKASAGSGKTYRLTQDYLDLLLSGDPQRYKHVLAVTFTNKATDEMKARVIEALYACSRNPEDPRAARAADCLSRILHDYSCFSVSTIDKFFQTVMRAFSRELGQYASYRVELDDKAVVRQVIDELLDSLSDPANEALLDWLRTYSFEQVGQGRSWQIDDSLSGMAEHFLDESFLRKIRNRPELVGDLARVKACSEKLDAMIRTFKDRCRSQAAAVQELAGRHGYTLDGFYRKGTGPMNVFSKWLGGKFDRPRSETIFEAFNAFPDRDGMTRLVGEAVRTWTDLNTAQVMRKHLHLLGIYSDVLRHLQDYLKRNNVVLLRQSADLLNQIIDQDDTPFVYEKIGNRFDHLLLDEAQDTSLLQWDNFKPLFRNSVAQGSASLVVGDIKQSIYRWRGSDWRLLNEYLYRDLGTEALRDETLAENWRSGAAVVAFNNRLFTQAGPQLAAMPDTRRTGEAVDGIYRDCAQRVPPQHAADPEGYVRLSFLSGEAAESAGKASWKELALERMLADIDSLLAAGYTCKEITVLVRTNTHGAEVASFLIDHGISVLTEDSLKIGASPCISRLMALLSRRVNPDDPVAQLLAERLGAGLDVPESGSLYETCERLFDDPALEHTEADLPFIYAFLDAVLAYQEKYGSSLQGFVNWWETAGCEKSICAPDGQNAVRVMTLHKSKGLSLDAVIIPFADEDFAHPSNHLPVLWCEPDGPFAELGLIPIKATQELLDTRFAADYEAETVLRHVDVVNNWYVACTRARSCLILYAPLPGEKKKNTKLKSFSELMHAVFAADLDDASDYVSGVLQRPSAKGEEHALDDDPQSTFARAEIGDRLRLSLHGADYFAQEESARQQGIEQHERMARVEADPELEALSGGRHWFDGTYRVLNETSIVDADGEIFRPDRVLIAPDGSRVVVVDYKFGRPHSGHSRQVRHYVSLLRQMGYPSVEGWLWYVSVSGPEQVC